MLKDEKMSIDERRKYLKLVKSRYSKANRKERGALLTEMGEVTGLQRKSLIRLMNMSSLERAPKKLRLRRRKYGSDVADVVRIVWESLDYLCAERLTPSLKETARQLAKWQEVTLTTEVELALGTISRATVQRLLIRFQQDTPKLPRRKPQPANQILKKVPMGRLSWWTDIPGSFETDLVHHCGDTASGNYIHTLQLIDIATGWSERVAVMGRNQVAMENGFRKVQNRLPFSIKHLHPDNGSEFFNDHLIRYFGEEITGMKLSRSRPYHKNDNRFVEQKNSTLVRAYIGYDRLDKNTQCIALNALYDQLWLYYNLFQPVMHMTEKEVINGKVHRKYDDANTPYQRLLSANILSPEEKNRLDLLYSQTNPRQLRRDIYEALEQLLDCSESLNIPDRKEAVCLR